MDGDRATEFLRVRPGAISVELRMTGCIPAPAAGDLQEGRELRLAAKLVPGGGVSYVEPDERAWRGQWRETEPGATHEGLPGWGDTR